MAIDQVASGGVDGALRHPVDKNGNVDYGRQYIALDTTGSATGETLDRTIVHELGHLLTLGKGQITEFTPAQLKAHEQVECEVYSTPECPAAGSYLYDYFTTFDYAEDAPYDDTEYPSQYATTLPTEDVAEIFAEWVLNDAAPFTVTDDGVDRTVNPGSVLQEKLHFFDAYPEVIEIRNRVRDGLGMR